MESNNLIPNNQHGFRPQRSTTSALAEVQQDLAANTENKWNLDPLAIKKTGKQSTLVVYFDQQMHACAWVCTVDNTELV